MDRGTIFLIRSQGFDRLARCLAETLATRPGSTVVAVVDERQGIADTAPFDKVSISEQALAELGLTDLPSNWGWFYGDLCYYLAAHRYPGFEYYCLIESDVFMSAAAAGEFAQALHSCDADALAAQLGPTEAAKKYSRGLADLGLDPAWGCIFPISRVSSPVLQAMMALRLAALRDHPDAVINDEAILAGAIQQGGFSHAALEDIAPPQFAQATFDTNPPHLFEAVSNLTDDLCIYHPVVPFDVVMRRVRSGEKNYTRHRLRKVLRAAPKHLKRDLKICLAEKENSQ